MVAQLPKPSRMLPFALSNLPVTGPVWFSMTADADDQLPTGTSSVGTAIASGL